MSRSPSFRVYASDFLGSPTVQLMEAAEVGAYWLLLLTAWEQERHGYLPDDHDKLRRWSRLSREQWTQSSELILGRFPVVEDGWRANSRMVLEAAKAMAFAKKQSLNGKKGGRPEKNPSLPSKNPSLYEKKPTHRKSKAKKSLPLPLPMSSKEDIRRSMCEPFVSVWNAERGASLPTILKLNESRVSDLCTRIEEGLDLEQWRKVVVICRSTPFLRGDGEGGWMASFDWLIEDDSHLTQVLEGKYGKTESPKTPSRPTPEAHDLYNSPEYQRKAVNL